MDIETKNNTPATFPAAVGTKGRYCSNGHQGTHCDQKPKPDWKTKIQIRHNYN